MVIRGYPGFHGHQEENMALAVASVIKPGGEKYMTTKGHQKKILQVRLGMGG